MISLNKPEGAGLSCNRKVLLFTEESQQGADMVVKLRVRGGWEEAPVVSLYLWSLVDIQE